MSVVDLSGYSCSGKSIVYDLLTCSESFYGFGVNFDFELIRAPGGIIDLREAISGENWSPIRSSDAIRRYFRLIENLGGNKKILHRITKTGNHYDYFFPNFTQISMNYLDNFIIGRMKAFWPYTNMQKSKIEIIKYKILSNLRINTDEEVFLSRVEPDVFDNQTRQYLKKIFKSPNNPFGQKLLISNAFEPFNPLKSCQLVDGSKSIIVDRDPRDIYLSALQSANESADKFGSTVVGNNEKDFVNRFKTYRLAVDGEKSPNIFRLKFESIIKDFDKTFCELCKFLEVDENSFELEKMNIEIENSSKNIQMWHRLHDQDSLRSINYIENKLSDYCIN